VGIAIFPVAMQQTPIEATVPTDAGSAAAAAALRSVHDVSSDIIPKRRT